VASWVRASASIGRSPAEQGSPRLCDASTEPIARSCRAGAGCQRIRDRYPLVPAFWTEKRRIFARPPAIADGAGFLHGCVATRRLVQPYPTVAGTCPLAFYATLNNEPSNWRTNTTDSPCHPEALINLPVHPANTRRIPCLTAFLDEMQDGRCRILPRRSCPCS